MSDYASGVEKKNVYEAFQWGNKVGTSLDESGKNDQSEI
jgi:hypothetical protein